jgi:hypothetical protein
VSSLVSENTVERFAPVIGAVAGGLLLHVVTHDLTEDTAKTPLSRTLDLLVAALGVGVSLFGIWHTGDPATQKFVRGLVQLAEHTSLVILVALLVSAFSLRTLDRGTKWGRALLPAAPLGAESVLLSIALFGFTSAGLRLLPTCAAVALLPDDVAGHPHDPPPALHWRARAAEALEVSGPWLLLGLLTAALLFSVPTAAPVEPSRALADLLVVALVANLAPVAAPAAVLISTGLSGVGLSTGGVLLFATLAPLAKLLGPALKPRLLATVSCLVVAGVATRLGLSCAPLDGALSVGELGRRSALALGALLLLGIWQRGARLWLSTIVRPPPHEHEHAHDVHGPHPH